MASTFFFYDLETTGFNARSARIVQFAGQRTDMELNPIGEPVNELIRLTPDILPEPDAVLLTGITPQQTISDGMTEAEFMRYFYQEVVKPDTIFLGFNSIRLMMNLCVFCTIVIFMTPMNGSGKTAVHAGIYSI